MNISRLIRPAVYLCAGIVIGALWSPLGRSKSTTQRTRSDADWRAENERFAAQVREKVGEEMGEFVRQFEDMTISVRQYPFDARASSDGRFVIRHMGDSEWMASDLRSPRDGGVVKELVRNYSFSSGGKKFAIDFGRGVKDPKVTSVVFRCTDAANHGFGYVDHDGDGRWDTFTDYSSESRRAYSRDGLCWKERAKPGTKQP